MSRMKSFALIVIAGFVSAICVLTHPGCTTSVGVDELSKRLEPLQVRRADGRVETITFAQAMTKHHEGHEHEHHTHADAVSSSTPAKPGGHHDTDEEEFCVGVTTGYQAIRYAAAKLFPGGIPNASDFELSAAGGMRGVRDILEMYSGKKPAPPELSGKKMSIKSFTFSARRISTGKTLRFRLRDGLIRPEFFKLKNRGVGCGDPALEALKKQAAEKILSLPPVECFKPVSS